jgi:hypothetical protein
MPDVPKIVHHRLRPTTPEQRTLLREHPEADVLTAFTEQALSAPEREFVMQHLALCGDCRDVVALALPIEELAASQLEGEAETPRVARARANWFSWAGSRWERLSWAHLSWAALAAGIGLAVLVARPGLEHRNPPVNSATIQPASPAGLPVATGQLPLVATEAGANDKGTDFGSKPALEKKTVMAKSAAPGMHAFAARKTSGSRVEASASPMTLTADASMGKNLGFEEAPVVRAKPPLETEMDGQANPAAAKTASVATMTAGTRASSSLQSKAAFALNGVAKPAAEEQNASWTITGGVLKRSSDGGQSWQTGLRTDRPVLCYAVRGQEVWAGGQAGILMHSIDGGATWSAVNASVNGRLLDADVMNIELHELSGIKLATSSHENWNSLDGGKTWRKD